jgi:glycosyltransferase involved in cell wall biosynthesis
MEKPLISFIITYYDLPVKMLCECIDSILQLSLPRDEREIIVIDDGSKKSPADELAPYEQYIIYIRQTNQGLSEARNTGIRMARGQYLQFVDGDDLMIKAPYEHCIAIARKKQPDIIVFDFTTNGFVPTEYHDIGLLSGSEYMRHYNIRGTACCYLFQLTTLSDLRFTSGIYNEDEEFTPLLLLRADTLCVTNAKAYYYRKRKNSIITTPDIRHKLRKLNDTRAIISRLNIQADRLPTDEHTALQRRVAQLTMDYIYSIIRQTRSRHYLERKLESLEKEGLFPLPDRNYTKKYTWFRRLTNSSWGLSLLMRIIPLMKKER